MKIPRPHNISCQVRPSLWEQVREDMARRRREGRPATIRAVIEAALVHYFQKTPPQTIPKWQPAPGNFVLLPPGAGLKAFAELIDNCWDASS